MLNTELNISCHHSRPPCIVKVLVHCMPFEPLTVQWYLQEAPGHQSYECFLFLSPGAFKPAFQESLQTLGTCTEALEKVPA